MLDHPFWEFYEKATRRSFKPDTPQEIYDKLKRLNCELFREEILKVQWRGMEIGSPRPKSFVGKDAVEQNKIDADALLFEFFNMVESGETFGDASAIKERYTYTVEDRIGKSSGLHYNFETAYWTFLINWNDWTRRNEEEYGCPLVCHLDSIFAHFNVALRSLFFRMPGPIKLPKWSIRWGQKRFLKKYAPRIADELYSEITSNSSK